VQVTRCDSGYEWVFDPAERSLLISVFERLVREYQVAPKDLSAEVRDAWYSSRGSREAGQSTEDFEEWIRQLRQFRGEYAHKAASWLQAWKADEQEPLFWVLDREDSDIFLTLMNDYRLARAAEMGIGEREMEASWEAIPDDKLRSAIAEIHIMAAMMECLIRLNDPSAG
jgi:hypothetical protein